MKQIVTKSGNFEWKHNRRSISTHAIDYWVGWKKILSLHDKACELDKVQNTNRHSLYFTTIFETGGRRNEVMMLQPEQIRWNEDIIKVTRMRVLKRRRTYVRDVFIKIDGNPLADTFIQHVQECDTKYLLPGYGSSVNKDKVNRFSKTINPDKHISRETIYKTICEIDPNIWTHWLRDQRSWQLSAPIEQGGRGFDSYLLKEWFNWASMDMPSHYAGRRSTLDILNMLGVKDIH